MSLNFNKINLYRTFISQYLTSPSPPSTVFFLLLWFKNFCNSCVDKMIKKNTKLLKLSSISKKNVFLFMLTKKKYKLIVILYSLPFIIFKAKFLLWDEKSTNIFREMVLMAHLEWINFKGFLCSFFFCFVDFEQCTLHNTIIRYSTIHNTRFLLERHNIYVIAISNGYGDAELRNSIDRPL